MKNLTEGNIYKTFFLFAIPLVFAGLLSQCYNVIDTVIAGKFLGADGLAAVGTGSAYITFCSSVLWGLGNGSALYTARLFGAADFKRVKSAVYNNFFVIASLAVVISLFSILLSKNILTLLNVDKKIFDAARLYFTVYFSGFTFIILSSYFVFIMQALGSSSYPFYMSLISTVLNIGGNLLLVAVFKTGAEGLAAASVFSAFVVDIFYVFKVRKCVRELGVAEYKIKPDRTIVKNSLRYGLPVMLQQSVMYVSSMLVSPIVNAVGSSATAAYTVVMKVYDINASVYQNSAKTLGNYISQSVGGRKYDKLGKGLKVGFIQGFALALPLIILSAVFAKRAALIFFPKDYTGDGLTYAVTFIRCFLPIIVFNIANNLFHNFFRGIGNMKCLIAATLIGSAANLTLSVVLSQSFGIYGVYAGWSSSWVIEAIFCISVYISGRWRKSLPE